MNTDQLTIPPTFANASDKAISLAMSMARAEKAIHDFTEGQVDAIVDPDGRAHLLRPAQQHLRREDRRSRAILDSWDDGITVVNCIGLILSQNRMATQMLGYARGEQVGRSFFDLVEPGELNQFQSAFFDVIEDSRDDAVVEVHLLTRDGSYRRIEATVSRLQDPATMCVVLTCRNVTAHEESMRREVELADSLLDRDRFLTVLSHELRVLRSPIRLGLDELDREELSPDVQSSLQMIRRNMELQSRLLDDLLDFTTLGQQKGRLRTEAIDTHEVIRRVLEICRSEITAARIEVQLDLRATESVVLADPVRLQYILWNLIKNVVKFSPPSSRVSIATTDQTKDWLTIEINDHGTDIKPTLLPFVFDSFRQSDPSSAPHNDGLGLGLFIVKGMAEAYGGTLNVLSKDGGKGVMFSLALPTTHRIAPSTNHQSS